MIEGIFLNYGPVEALYAEATWGLAELFSQMGKFQKEPVTHHNLNHYMGTHAVTIWGQSWHNSSIVGLVGAASTGDHPTLTARNTPQIGPIAWNGA